MGRLYHILIPGVNWAGYTRPSWALTRETILDFHTRVLLGRPYQAFSLLGRLFGVNCAYYTTTSVPRSDMTLNVARIGVGCHWCLLSQNPHPDPPLLSSSARLGSAQLRL